LIGDILNRLPVDSAADYFIYTNVDIALMPFFYDTVYDIIHKGYDAFIINRRTISNEHILSSDLHYMYAEAGTIHPGLDCFIFKKDFLHSFQLGKICIGAGFIGAAMLGNLIAFSTKMKIFRDLHATFHIGDDGIWKQDKFQEYTKFNYDELVPILDAFLLHESVASNPEKVKLILKLKDDIDRSTWGKPKKTPAPLVSLSFKKRVVNRLIHLLQKI
jgi:hypothetical protein